MMEPQSNNPFRHSMLPPTIEEKEPSSPQSLRAPVNIYTHGNQSAATTIAPDMRPSHADLRPSQESTGTELANAKTVVGSCESLEMQPITNKAGVPKEDVIITINTTRSENASGNTLRDSASFGKSPRPSMAGGDRRSVRQSMQVDQCAMWPSRKQNEKARLANKRKWIVIKVVIALVIIIGAVALGLGITKAVKDAKKN